MLSAIATSALILAASVSAQPTQIQIHPTGGKNGEISVDFVVPAGQTNGKVQYGSYGSSNTVPTTNFAYPEIGQLHQAVISFDNAQAGQPAWYQVTGDGATWSTNFSIVPVVASPRFAVFGDFGLTNDVSMQQLATDAAANAFDYVLHVGDFAYDMEEQGSSVGNQFQQLASTSYAAIKPVAVVPGNHEACGGCAAIPNDPTSRGNFSQYRARFYSVQLGAGVTSGSSSNIFYSFNMGLTHFIGFSAESYAYRSGAELLANQLAFMKADLAAVDRGVTPWVVALVHKDWNMEAEAYAAFYPVLDAGNVDVLFCGHIHYYNRNLPYDAVTKEMDQACVSGPEHDQTYTNPKYMTNIVTGASGDKEGETPCVVNILLPSITCTADFGYGIWEALNSTHAHWRFASVKPDYIGPANYTDSLMIVQTGRGHIGL